jgi:hypothetical protein
MKPRHENHRSRAQYLKPVDLLDGTGMGEGGMQLKGSLESRLSYRFPSRRIKAGETKEAVITEFTSVRVEMNENQ